MNSTICWVVRAAGDAEPVSISLAPKEELTDMEWEVFPKGLHDLLIRLEREYRPPLIYITENGAAHADGPDEAGRLTDTRRVEFSRCYSMTTTRRVATLSPARRREK